MLRCREDAVSHAAVICPSQRGGDAGLYDLVPLERFKSACRPDISPRWAITLDWLCGLFPFFYFIFFYLFTADAPKAAVKGQRRAGFVFVFFVFVFSFARASVAPDEIFMPRTTASTVSGPAAAGVFVSPSFGEQIP